MAVRTNSNTDFLSRTTGLLDYNGNYSFMFWLMNIVDTGGSTTTYTANDGSLNSFDLAGHDGDGTTTRLTVRTNGGNANTSTGTNLPLGVWHHWCIVRSASNQIRLYINGVSNILNSTATSGRSAVVNNQMGIQVGGFAPFNGKFDKIKEFNVALTSTEIQAEMWRTLPQIADGRLNDFAPVMIGPTSNKALRGNDWIENGTLTDESGSPTTWGGTSVIPIFPAAVAGGGIITSSLDAFLQKQISITASADAQIQKTLQLTAQADSILQKAFTLVSNADSLIQKNINATAQADGLLQKAISLISNADAILTVLGSGIITSSTDAHLQKLISLVTNADAILVKIGVLQASADAILQKTSTRTTQTDAILQKTLSNQSNADALLIRIASITASADAILTGLTNIFASADALIQKIDLSLISNADAILQLPGLSIRVRRFNGLKHIDKNGKLR